MATKPSTGPTSTTRAAVGLDLAAHPIKRQLLAEVARFNEIGAAPTVAEVVRAAEVGRDASRYRTTRWRAGLASLADAGYLRMRSGPRGYMLSVTDAGLAALDDSA